MVTQGMAAGPPAADADPAQSALPALAVGSHLDSVPDGGAFDGPLGVVCALYAGRRFHDILDDGER